MRSQKQPPGFVSIEKFAASPEYECCASHQRPTVTVLFIGGSNVYGAEVPDDMTIPSQLSERLNQLDPAHRYLVVNAGVTGADSVLEKGRLDYELAHGQKPDIVLVMDGGREFESTYFETMLSITDPMGSSMLDAETLSR
jgi:hypothetical protein